MRYELKTLVAVSLLALLLLAGCANSTGTKTAADGPPPGGYNSTHRDPHEKK